MTSQSCLYYESIAYAAGVVAPPLPGRGYRIGHEGNGRGVSLNCCPGGWVRLRELGYNSQSLTNSVRAWITRNRAPVTPRRAANEAPDIAMTRPTCPYRPTVVALFVCVAAGCSGAKNDEQAYYFRQGAAYVIELRGRRDILAHDPLSALRRKTSETSYQLVVPRIEGTIDGREIPRRPGRLRYSGTIEIARERMTITLAYRNDDDTRLDPFTWNGSYRLHPK